MSTWKYVAVVAAIGVTAPAEAQLMDWGPTMAVEAHNSATGQAARQGSRSSYQARRKPNSAPPSTRSRVICADARDADNAGSRNPELPRLLRLCSRAGL